MELLKCAPRAPPTAAAPFVDGKDKASSKVFISHGSFSLSHAAAAAASALNSLTTSLLAESCLESSLTSLAQLLLLLLLLLAC